MALLSALVRGATRSAISTSIFFSSSRLEFRVFFSSSTFRPSSLDASLFISASPLPVSYTHL
ncbi:MAG: hypothetical protein QUS09_07275, partial [Methanotrichaceae archaeon]|nr:hypothetical protein [Methanotrichaceae archaeon]